jgi:hypothetical protein
LTNAPGYKQVQTPLLYGPEELNNLSKSKTHFNNEFKQQKGNTTQVGISDETPSDENTETLSQRNLLKYSHQKKSVGDTMKEVCCHIFISSSGPSLQT